MYCNKDMGMKPYVANIMEEAMNNRNFRSAIWTGTYVQMTLMCIPPCGDVGMEIHPETDQIIRIEYGSGMVIMGKDQCSLSCRKRIQRGDVVFVPAGTWHNIVNTGKTFMKLSTVYAPPHHPYGTVHCTKEDAENAY